MRVPLASLMPLPRTLKARPHHMPYTAPSIAVACSLHLELANPGPGPIPSPCPDRGPGLDTGPGPRYRGLWLRFACRSLGGLL